MNVKSADYGFNAKNEVLTFGVKTLLAVLSFLFDIVTYIGIIILSMYFAMIYIHTYVHNLLLQLFSQDYNSVFPNTYVVCVNFYA